MDIQSLERSLADLPIGGLRYFERIGSTNNEAISWAEDGASDLSNLREVWIGGEEPPAGFEFIPARHTLQDMNDSFPSDLSNLREVLHGLSIYSSRQWYMNHSGCTADILPHHDLPKHQEYPRVYRLVR